MQKIREWRGGGGEKEEDPERRGSVEKKSKQQFTRREKGALNPTLKFSMI